MTFQTAIFDLSPVLHYPIKLSVNRWDSERPLHWSSFNEEGVVAEGQFLEAPGLPLFTLENDEGNRLSDSIPPELSHIAQLMPAMDFELAQACAVSGAARELALDSPLLFLFVVELARRESLSIDEFERLLSLKRAEILQRLGFAGSKSLARLMRRIALSPLLPWELDDIATVLRNPAFLSLPDPAPESSPAVTSPAGATMHHCVGSYDIPVALGDVFIYRMVEPERLTVSLEQHDDRWVVGEVRGYCNANPSVGALELVRRWAERKIQSPRARISPCSRVEAMSSRSHSGARISQ
jgi:hypothetical protein